MDHCLIPSKCESAFFLVALVFCVFVSFIWITITEAFSGIVLALFIIFILFWFVMLLLSAVNLIVQNRKYTVDNHGITISSFGNRSTFHPWQSFRDIGICKVHYTSRLPYDYDVVIRFSQMDESSGPKSGTWGPWATEFYGLIHFRKILLITFTQARLDQLTAIYPDEIADYRHIKRNAFEA